MYAFLYLTTWSVLLLTAENLLRAAGLTVPLLGFFLAAAALAVSPHMALFFAFVFGIMLDFAAGYSAPWSGILLPLLTVPAFLMKGKRGSSGVMEFLGGALIPPVMALPHLRSVFTTPEGFASLFATCLLGAVLFPVMLVLVTRSAVRLRMGAAGTERGNW